MTEKTFQLNTHLCHGRGRHSIVRHVELHQRAIGRERGRQHARNARERELVVGAESAGGTAQRQDAQGVKRRSTGRGQREWQ